MQSLAPACILCYLLQVKDRHNGNILLDAEGHIIHIDFGFILASSPGGNLAFESAPFKLTPEFVELMGGPSSMLFRKFRELCVRTFMALRRERHKLTLLVEMLVAGSDYLPCFAGRPHEAVEALRRRFHPEISDGAAADKVHELIDKATNNWRTAWYDEYQRCCVGIY